jgi:hypothetical protein
MPLPVAPTPYLESVTGAGSSTAITAPDLDGALVVAFVSGTVTDFNIETQATAGTWASAFAVDNNGQAVELDALAASGVWVLRNAGFLNDEIRATIVTGTGSVTLVVLDKSLLPFVQDLMSSMNG